MQTKNFKFSSQTTRYFFDAAIDHLHKLADPAQTVLVTDENIFNSHRKKFKPWRTIVLPAGEQHKVQPTVDQVIKELIGYQADRQSVLVGVGGGVITDITGYAASIYMRGIRFGFVPVSLLAMVDASIGGKNGIDVGVYKNLAGTINQPEFLLYDSSFLKSLPPAEWVNGFAEIIKHASIKDANLFAALEKNSPATYKKDKKALDALVRRNATIKSAVVLADEFEQGERKLLNFGHTWGHAIETKYQLPHGHAVAIGMVMACKLSERLTGFRHTERVAGLIQKYGLPVSLKVDVEATWQVLKMDKKKDRASMNYVLLDRIGRGVIRKIPMEQLEELIVSVSKQT